MSRQESLDAEFTEFTEFMVARRDQLFRSAYLLTTSSAAAEDLLQTALTKTYVSWMRVRRTEDPAAYVHRVMLNAFLSDRRRRSSSEVPVAATRDAPCPPPAIDDRLMLFTALSQLTPLDRAVVVLRYWEDRSLADTALELDLSQAAVKNRSLRALRLLRQHLCEPSDPKGARS